MSLGGLHEFSAVIEDLLPARKGPAVWAYVNNARIVGFDESLKKIVDAAYAPPNGGYPIFTEGKDGKLYGVINDAAFKLRQVVKLTPSATSISAQNVTTFPGGVFPDGRVVANIEGAVVVGPGGQIYFTENHDPLFTGASLQVEAFGIGYKRLAGASLADAGSIQSAWIGYTDLVINNPPVNSQYNAVNHTPTVYRHFRHAILSTGRWVTADKIREIPSGGLLFLECTSPSDTRSHFINDVNDPVGMTVRIWGNAWWDRPDDASAWSAVANSGLSSLTTSLYMTGPNPDTVEIGNPPSKNKTIRVNQRGAIDYLPTQTFSQQLWQGAGSINTAVPYQNTSMVVADGAFLYLLVLGAYDTSSVYHPGGVYRAPIPLVGAAPIWSQIIAEPSASAGWWSMTVSQKWIWISTSLGTILAYSKADVTISKTVFSGSGIPRSLTTGWSSRWR